MRVPLYISERLIRSTLRMRGEAGARWLEGLPALVSELERRWSFEVGRPYPGLWVNWVAPAVCGDGAPAVLKLSFPGDKEFRTEAGALGHFDGRGTVRLLRLDRDRGAMLVERCEPGEPLLSVPDDGEATDAAAGVMRRLWRPAPGAGPAGHPFPSVADWARGLCRLRRRFGGGTGPMPVDLVERAEALFGELVPSQEARVLLHGDFHHENVLSSRRGGWLAIDPKGVVGEPAYDAATLLREPPGLVGAPDARGKIERRLDQLPGGLGLDRARLHGWALAQAVLAAYWGLEDSGRVWDEALAFAGLLASIRP